MEEVITENVTQGGKAVIQTEMFCDIPNTNGCYRISSNGEASRRTPSKWRKANSFIDKYGYLLMRITIGGGVKKNLKLHRLVAQSFIPNPSNLPEVNHKDGNKLNNQYTNLEWSTTIDNIKHAKNNKLNAFGVKSATSKLKECDIVEIRRMYSAGIRIADISRVYKKVTQQSIGLIVRKQTWKHLLPDHKAA